MNDVDRASPAAEVGRLARAVLDAVGTVVVGKRDALELVLAGILAGGHVLLEDLPGLGKTLTARSLRAGARAGLPPAAVHPRPAARRRHRLVPLRPAQRTTSPSGPARSSPTCCSPTRSTGRRRRPSRRCWRRCRRGRSRSRAPPTALDPPFHVLATANPIEYEGTYPLPEAQLDRFLLRVSFGYPQRRRGVGGAAPPDGPPPGGGGARAGGRRRRPCWPCRPPWRTWWSRTRSAGTSWRWPRRPGSTRRCWSARRRAARWRCCCWPGPRPRWPAATTWSPRTSRRSRCPRWRTGSRCGPEMWLRRVDPAVRGRRGAGRRRPAPASGALPSYARAGRGRAVDRSATGRVRRPSRGRHGPSRLPDTDPGARPGGAARRPAAARRRAARPGRPGRAGRAVRARHRVRAARAGPPRAAGRGRPPADADLVEGGELDASGQRRQPRRRRYDLVVVRACAVRRAGLPAWTPAATARTRGPAVRDRRPIGAASTWHGRGAALGPAPVGPAPAHGCRRPTGCCVSRPVRHRAACAVQVYPATEPFDAAEAMPRAAGLVGGHRSRRPGEGGELAGVRRFGPGDRLRRIDWRVSLRTRRAARRRTLSDRDAEVVRPARRAARGGPLRRHRRRARRCWTPPSGPPPRSPSTTCTAATGSRCWSTAARPAACAPASGRRQYLTVAGVAARRRTPRPSPTSRRPGLRPAAALRATRWSWCSPRCWTPRSALRCSPDLARAGRFVVAVDTLPTPRPPRRRRAVGPRWPTGCGGLERDNVIGQLREHGVPVVPWAGAGSLDQVLRDVTRVALSRTVTR